MRNIKYPLAVLCMAVVIAALAGASVAGPNPADATANGVVYDWLGDWGEVTIVGDPGTRFDAFDSFGNPIAEGVLDGSDVSFVTGNSGAGPDGTIVFVLIGNDVVAVTDPNWDWD
jgi:hypothetical protein